MPQEPIKSKKNEAVKFFIKLQNSAAFRRETGLFPVEGARLCADGAQSGISIKRLYYTEQAFEKYASYLAPVLKAAEESCPIDPSVAKAMSAVESPQGIFCVCQMPAGMDMSDVVPGGRYLAAENMQDPSNLGAVLRTGEALGLQGILLSENSCDLYSPKVLRSSMGAVFRFPVCICSDLPEVLRSLTAGGFQTLGAVAGGEALSVEQPDYQKGCVMAVGNEGNGLSREAREACSALVTIPMKGRAESLNAAAAAAILIWEMMRG